MSPTKSVSHCVTRSSTPAVPHACRHMIFWSRSAAAAEKKSPGWRKRHRPCAASWLDRTRAWPHWTTAQPTCGHGLPRHEPQMPPRKSPRRMSWSALVLMGIGYGPSAGFLSGNLNLCTCAWVRGNCTFYEVLQTSKWVELPMHLIPPLVRESDDRGMLPVA